MSGSLLTLLRSLSSADVDFVVVGGMAGVLQGAPVVTADLDIVHRRSAENVSRLLRVLEELRAVFRADPRMLTPKAEHLMGSGHLLLTTRLGPLDVLCEISGQGFEELLPHSEPVQLGQELQAPVLRLEKLIELKAAAGRPKDLAALPVLRATLAERTRR